VTTVVSRRVASTPARTASDTWRRIIDILAPDAKSAARTELESIAGVACSSIASEALKDDAVVVQGSGPRVRVYCVFGDDAVSGEDVEEGKLAKTPTGGDWTLSLPCKADDLTWSQAALSRLSSRITARCVGDDVPERSAKLQAAAERAINIEEFRRS
jgi:hypothetical protein